MQLNVPSDENRRALGHCQMNHQHNFLQIRHLGFSKKCDHLGLCPHRTHSPQGCRHQPFKLYLKFTHYTIYNLQIYTITITWLQIPRLYSYAIVMSFSTFGGLLLHAMKRFTHTHFTLRYSRIQANNEIPPVKMVLMG